MVVEAEQAPQSVQPPNELLLNLLSTGPTKDRLRTVMVKVVSQLRIHGTLNAAQAEIHCTCRYAGTSYDQNSCVCLTTPSGPRMACCEKVLNNTSWTFKGDNCPMAAAPDRSPMQSFAPEHERPRDRALWRLGVMVNYQPQFLRYRGPGAPSGLSRQR